MYTGDPNDSFDEWFFWFIERCESAENISQSDRRRVTLITLAGDSEKF